MNLIIYYITFDLANVGNSIVNKELLFGDCRISNPLLVILGMVDELWGYHEDVFFLNSSIEWGYHENTMG